MLSEIPDPDSLIPEQQWIKAWRNAAIELPKIRNAELRAMSDEASQALLGSEFVENPYENGLFKFQQWMMRLHLLNLQNKTKQDTSP